MERIIILTKEQKFKKQLELKNIITSISNKIIPTATKIFIQITAE